MLLRIEWEEKDGPPVSEPQRRGFGTALIERGVSGDLDGRVELAFEPAGIRCVIEIPLAAAAFDTDRGSAALEDWSI